MVDVSALARWPNVPACYEWLSLDRRGDWRLQGERVSHRGLIDFMNRQYGADEHGAWFVLNGPQRVFVDLAVTPWVFRRQGDDFLAHTGQPAGNIKHFLIDESGSFYLDAELGIGLVDDRDLTQVAAECTNAKGEPAGEDDFLAAIEGKAGIISWQGHPATPVISTELPGKFGFNPRPRP